MDPLKLLITDTTFLLTRKGTTLLEKTFSSDEELFSLLTPAFKNYKSSTLECLFGGSRLVVKTQILTYEEKESFLADSAVLNKLVMNASHTLLSDHKEAEFEIVDISIRSIKLNGYPVKELKKEKATKLQSTVFFAALPSLFKRKLLEAVKPLKKEHVQFGACAESLVERVHTLSKKEEFLTCSAYERSTDIALRKNDNFFEMISIPIGTHHAIEHLMKGLQLNEEQSESHLSLYNEGKLDPVLTSKVETSILSFQISLDEEIKKALTLLSEGLALPSYVFLLVAPSFQRAYDSAFKSDSYHALCFGDAGFEVAGMSSILTS